MPEELPAGTSKGKERATMRRPLLMGVALLGVLSLAALNYAYAKG